MCGLGIRALVVAAAIGTTVAACFSEAPKVDASSLGTSGGTVATGSTSGAPSTTITVTATATLGSSGTGPDPGTSTGALDTEAPEILAFTVNGATTVVAVSEPQIVLWEVMASDNVGIERVEFLDDGMLVGTDLSAPFSQEQLVSSSDDGTHVLSARAFDAAGNVGTSSMVSLEVGMSPGGSVVVQAQSGTRRLSALASDEQGNLLIAGWQDDGANDDVWIAKFAPNGTQLLWEATHAGSGGQGDRGLALARGLAGEVLVAGFDRSAIFDLNWWTGCFTPAAGNLSWQASYGGDFDDIDRAVGIAVDGSGTIAVVGSITEVGVEPWVVGYSQGGMPLWEVPLGGSDVTVSAVAGAQDGFYIAGTDATGAVPLAWLRRIDGEGLEVWTQTYAAQTGEAHAYAVARIGMGPQAGVVMTGMQGTESGGPDLWVARVNAAAGVVQWQTVFDGGAQEADSGEAIAVGPGGYVAVVGTFRTEDPVAEHAVALRLDGDDGVLQWEYVHPDPAFRDRGKAATVDPLGYVWLGADSFSDPTDAQRLVVKLSP